MVTFPNAKINLGLYVTGKRRDGYHNLETAFYPVPWCDVLEVVQTDKTSFQSTGLAIPGESKENLCMQAYTMLRKDFQLEPVQMHLHKLIPIGAGLGGGSADGAFALKLISDLFELYLDDSLLEEYAARLGSDCPFFIGNQPVVAKGRGDEFEELNLDLSGYHLVLVNPGIQISTKEAYAGVSPKAAPVALKEVLETTRVDEWKAAVHNDFEDSIFPNYPALAELKDQLYRYGADYAAMSGSGSTLYGLYTDAPTLPDFPKEYQVWQGQL